MQITPAQQRLIAAAQRRRLMEYERELAAWRAEQGLAPAENVPARDVYARPAMRVQTLWLLAIVLGSCLLSAAVLYSVYSLIVWMIGGAL